MNRSRFATVIIATAGVLALLASFHTSPGTPTRVAGSSGRAAPTPAAAAPPPQGATPSTAPSAGAPPPATSGTGPRSVDGDTVSTKYGDVQVRVVVAGGRLVDVQALALPSDRARSVGISNHAGPLLRQEALQAQSASINTVSGATYTSHGYAQSLQSALDRAGLKA